MNSALPDHDVTRGATAVERVLPASVVLYIDADNQSPQCAKALVDLLQIDFDARIVSATIAGNNHGLQLDNWRDELIAIHPGLLVHPLNAPHRKQAADVALLMALGADLERHIQDRVLVVVVSRDDLVIGAAEQAKARGCRTLIAYADSDLQTARNTQLTTLLLPALVKPISVVQPPPVVTGATTQAPLGRPNNAPANDPVVALLAKVRGMCTQKPGGGYASTDVGQALAKLGYDKAARARFLASVPGLKKRGAGPNLTLVF